MSDTIDVLIPVNAEAAPALANPEMRVAMGRLISRVLLPDTVGAELDRAFAEARAEARANGLTDEDIEEELRIYNSERRTSATA